jgi:hypothetical protein
VRKPAIFPDKMPTLEKAEEAFNCLPAAYGTYLTISINANKLVCCSRKLSSLVYIYVFLI